MAVKGFVRTVVAAATEVPVAELDGVTTDECPEVGATGLTPPQPMPAKPSNNARVVRTAALGTRLAKTPGPILSSPSPRKP